MQKKNNYKFFYKKLIRLRINPFNNNRFFKLKVIKNKKIEKNWSQTPIYIKRFEEINKIKKKKWHTFLIQLKKKNSFFKKFKSYTFNHHKVSKFASQGNAFKKKFRNDLFAKKIFNIFYGGLKKKYMKKKMGKIYKSKNNKELRNVSVENFERRLESAIFRAKFCTTIKDARQLINHSHIKVNNTIEKNGYYKLKQGDIIKVCEKSIKIVKNKLRKQLKEQPNMIFIPLIPSYLSVNYRTLEIFFGNIDCYNFSNSFNFKLDHDSIVTKNYRN